jgi:putative radical SAM enzyme (TIGR03279 family)
MRERDIERITEMHISPVNVSVHTTNPELRVKMMKNKRAGEVLSYLGRLADAGISLCCQIVLCKGLNDGEELERTMRDLEGLYPALVSTSVVPAGLTKYREGLYELEAFSPEECREVLKQVNSFGDACKEKYGTRLFYPADELYIKGGVPLPSEDFYEDFSQIENGVGMLASLESEFRTELDYLDEYLPGYSGKREVSIATGYAAFEHIFSLARLIEGRVEGLRINVYPIKNYFFGESITVAGLLTGTDMEAQLKEMPLGDALLIPSVTLRADGDLFLDGKTPEWLSESLGVPVTAVDSEGCDLIRKILGTT